MDAVTGVISPMQSTKSFSSQVKMWSFVQQHLLKTSKSIRELHSSAADVVHKVREWVKTDDPSWTSCFFFFCGPF